MKSCGKISVSVVVLIHFLILFLLSGIGGAEGAPKKISLDLSPRPEPETGERAETLEEKYQEALDEIEISEEAAYVVENIKNALTELQDLEADVYKVEQRGTRSEEARGKLMVNFAQRLVARLEMQAPSALRGQIIVMDEEKAEAHIYMPVNNQINVLSLKDMGEEALSSLNEMIDLATLFDFSRYQVSLLSSSKKDGVNEYLLYVSGFEDQTQEVLVRDDTWIPCEILVFKDGQLTGKLELKNVVLNQLLDLETIRDLPDVKKFHL
ncbi:MAG: hypothetical protein GX335_10750 [Firmicutes bacterium]|nr:hypothetical protein [Bacillota bacterium]